MDQDLRSLIASIPVEEPDAFDLRMIEEVEGVNDGTTVTLEEFSASLEE